MSPGGRLPTLDQRLLIHQKERDLNIAADYFAGPFFPLAMHVSLILKGLLLADMFYSWKLMDDLGVGVGVGVSDRCLLLISLYKNHL